MGVNLIISYSKYLVISVDRMSQQRLNIPLNDTG